MGFKLTKMICAGMFCMAFVVILFHGTRYTSSPSFCIKCHESREKYVVWSLSSHSKIDCMVCHREPGEKGLVKQNLEGLTNMFLHLAGGKPKGQSLAVEIDNNVCLQCHTLRRMVTPFGDVMASHEIHIRSGNAGCIDCHGSISHGGKELRAQLENFSGTFSLDEEREKIQKEIKNWSFRPSMGVCLRCHDGKKAPSNCEICHQKVGIPGSHKTPGWSNGHGKIAMSDFPECLYCHSIISGMAQDKENNIGKEPAVAIMGNDFCRECHVRRPEGHGQNWQVEHGSRAHSREKGCMVCHGQEDQGNQINVREIVSCKTCHGEPHIKNWRQIHKQVVKREGFTSCSKCHDVFSCSNCHTRQIGKAISKVG